MNAFFENLIESMEKNKKELKKIIRKIKQIKGEI
jgi:hypothetical protein